jgi:DNA-binding transcriptional LysR family regulator
MAELAATGLGATVLPCFVGDLRAGLVRVGAPIPELDVDLWLLTHEDLRHSARVRAFMELAGAELAQRRALLEGLSVEAA